MADFAGFDDYIEVARVGEWMPKEGKPVSFSAADLDEFVRNHDPKNPVPIVIGHPDKTQASPAFGWSEKVRRFGDGLFVKFTDVNPAFVEGVKKKAWPNRSIRAAKGKNGWGLVHVGFLGAAPPAIPGMEAISFAAPEGEVFDFSADWYTVEAQAGLWRRFKNWLIGEKGQEVADSIVPEWDIESLTRSAANQRAEELVQPPEQPAMASSFSQADLDQAVTVALKAQNDKTAELERQLAEARKARADQERQVNLSAWQGKVTAAIDKGVPPALLTGLPEFAASLAAGEQVVEFDFSAPAGEGKTTTTTIKVAEWLDQHLARVVDLAARVPMQARDLGAGDVVGADFSAAVSKHMKDNPGVGAAAAAQAVRNQRGG